ncbi:DUF1168-domain-containing protein [Lentinus tigrinus ALCF2SS1-6]|uniref:DUF1168-domain-containing protein n=1 Tax=Lentinus tigrinus ALCF2SS1-6 TaxID=1328759 RepID=A0A5C2RPI2_9APHY|nr:DUF1168-domain-containing protein [Lentinus tigrinus ALCF2SS1-6]
MSASPAASPSPAPGSSGHRHASTPLDKQRAQLEKLLKDPAKPAYVPPPPKEKSIRPAREMMKNVQGSSAGAGSGEFHVYKASRRREYERLKMMEEQAQKETTTAEFERKKREWEEAAEAKTAKNRAKRQKKKERSKGKGAEKEKETDAAGGAASGASGDQPEVPFKKRRLVSGKELVFRRPGEEDEDDEDEDENVGPEPAPVANVPTASDAPPVPIVDAPRITIIEDD